MNIKITYTLLCFILCTSYAVGQSDVIFALEGVSQKVEFADNQRDTSALSIALIDAIVTFSKPALADNALIFFGRLMTLPANYTQTQPKMALVYEAVAKIYCHKKEYFIATTYAERAIKSAPNQEEKIKFSQQLCDILLLQNSIESRQKITETLKFIALLLKKNSNKTCLPTYFRQKGAFSILEKHYTEGIFLIEKAIPIFEKNKNNDELIPSYTLLSEAYDAKKEPSKALYYLQKHLAIKEKIVIESHNIKDIYDNRKKDKTLIINASNQEKQEKKAFYATILIGILASVISFLLIVFWYYRRQSKQKIALQNNNIQVMMNELKAFNYSVSHDLKAPLVEMYNSLTLLDKKERAKLNDKNQAKLQLLSQTLLNTHKMIDEMLAYSIADNQIFEPQKFDMKDLLEDILYQFSATIEAKGIEVRITPNFPQVYGDLAMIRQVFQNLISNAIKFSQNNPSPILQLDYKKESARIVFSVSDNGIGFDKQHKNKLFQLFKRLPTQEKFEGIGAGLAIVKRIVERHGGTAWAEGRPNQGAIFYFSLPKLS